jgi:hypothetical protein
MKERWVMINDTLLSTHDSFLYILISTHGAEVGEGRRSLEGLERLEAREPLLQHIISTPSVQRAAR